MEPQRDLIELEDEELGGESACWAHMLDDEGHLQTNAGWRLTQAAQRVEAEGDGEEPISPTASPAE